MHCAQCRERLKALNATDINIIVGLAQGKTQDEIGKDAGLAGTTIKNYVSLLLSKIGVRNRVGLMVYAFKHHVVELDEV